VLFRLLSDVNVTGVLLHRCLC